MLSPVKKKNKSLLYPNSCEELVIRVCAHVQISMYVSRGNYVIRGTLHREATARWENRISTLTLRLEHR